MNEKTKRGKPDSEEQPRNTSGDATAPTSEPEAVGNSDLKSFRVWADELGTPDWQLAGVVAQEDWAEGYELKQADYKKAITKMMKTELR